MRHDFAGERNAHNLLNIDRIKEKGDLRGAAVDGVERGGSFALVGKITFGGDGLMGDAEGRLENSVVQEDDVQFALQRRDAVEELGKIGARAQGENIVSALG